MTRLDELDFPLPEELIATEPAGERGTARLMRISCRQGACAHHEFRTLPELLEPGDLLVLNDTRVVPARLVGRKVTGGRFEGLWLRESSQPGMAECLISGSRLRPGVQLLLTNGEHRLRLVRKLSPGRWLLEDESGLGWLPLLQKAGATPLPPYVRGQRRRLGMEEELASDRARYQTVFAARDGAVAAPTASLHFEASILAALEERGVELCRVTLHVGEGTFLPISVDEVERHPMHEESFVVSDRAAQAVQQARLQGRRIVAAGTTVCRALESLPADLHGATSGATDLYIRPGHAFRWVDGLLTNFHTPRSTLLLLVAAFAAHLGGAGSAGLDFVKQVYRTAVEERYRFYSYGDASLWLP